MNSREQFLLKRIRELELRLALTMQELQRVATDRDYTESVGCAFAWDMVVLTEAEKVRQTRMTESSVDYLHALVEAHWNGAVKATENMLDEATK